MSDRIRPALVGLDWGTSSLRAYLFDAGGAVIESRERPWGVQALPAGGFPAAFRAAVDGWPALPVVACGMVGSRQGWREAAYVECPLDLRDLAGGLLRAETECGPLAIVPGVVQRGAAPDVMRGEETQLFGALGRHADVAGDWLGVLPGTHSKWATIRGGRLTGFTTFMTGELFATLRDHSLLGRPAREAQAAPPEAVAAAFARGVRAAAAAGPRGVAGLLFSARSLWLTGKLGAAETLDYLSGLLIGDEIRGMTAGRGAGDALPLVLVGAAGLGERYRAALAACGLADVRLAGDTAAAGLWRIAVEAGLTT